MRVFLVLTAALLAAMSATAEDLTVTHNLGCVAKGKAIFASAQGTVGPWLDPPTTSRLKLHINGEGALKYGTFKAGNMDYWEKLDFTYSRGAGDMLFTSGHFTIHFDENYQRLIVSQFNITASGETPAFFIQSFDCSPF